MATAAWQAKEAPPPAAAAVAAVPEPDAWVELRLVDQDGAPYAGRVEIELPDGAKVTRSATELGIVRVEGIRAGTCRVRVLGVDASAWQLA